VSNQERKYLKSIEYFVGKKYELKRYPGFDHTKKETPVAEAREAHPQKREHREHHRSERAGQSRHPQRRRDRNESARNQSPRHGHRQIDAKKSVVSPAANAVKEADWRKLMQEGKGERDGFRKKQKRLFKRS
jgi:hypothetical protein